MTRFVPIVLALILASLAAMFAHAAPPATPGGALAHSEQGLDDLITTLEIQAAVLAAEAKGVAHSEQGAEKMALLYSGTAKTKDGRVLKDGAWFGPDQAYLLQPGAIVITAEMQVIIAIQQTGFHTALSPLAMYCPGCACGCGKTVAYWQSPSGEMDNAWCDDHKEDPCVDDSDGTPSWHLTGTCISSWVPCK